jgi:hypothetical protein
MSDVQEVSRNVNSAVQEVSGSIRIAISNHENENLDIIYYLE